MNSEELLKPEYIPADLNIGVSHEFFDEDNLNTSPDMAFDHFEFFNEQESTSFDFNRLKKDFSTICRDYGDELDENWCVANTAVAFSETVLFSVGPELRSTNRGVREIFFKDEYRGGEVPPVRIVFITNHRVVEFNDGYKPDSRITLTVLEAELLALETGKQLVKVYLSQDPPKMFMTQLAQELYTTENILDISQDLGISIEDVLIAVNASCQYGGHYLAESRMEIAMVAANVVTRGINYGNIKEKLRDMICQQYQNKGKQFDDVIFDVYSKYATQY